MKIVIWGTGHRERLIESYINEDVEIVAFVDNDKNNWGKAIRVGKQDVLIICPQNLKDLLFDYCLIAADAYPKIIKQYLDVLSLPKEKVIQAVNLSVWDKSLICDIFNENILENPENYIIEGYAIDLGKGHALPIYQKQFKMYDRFMPFLGKMAQSKEGELIIDIGANVGDTLAAMLNYTNDTFLCIEPVKAFYNLLVKNIRSMGVLDRVYTEQAFITDKIEESYSAKVMKQGTAHKEQVKEGNIPSKTMDYVINEKRLDYTKVDLVKIDTDGFDADCIVSADELLKKGSPLIYWENYIETFEQYRKYLEAYSFLNERGYLTFYIFDNYGNYLCKGNIDTIHSIADYMQRVNTGCIGDTFSYFDVLTCKSEDVSLCERNIANYLKKYSLYRMV